MGTKHWYFSDAIYTLEACREWFHSKILRRTVFALYATFLQLPLKLTSRLSVYEICMPFPRKLHLASNPLPISLVHQRNKVRQWWTFLFHDFYFLPSLSRSSLSSLQIYLPSFHLPYIWILTCFRFIFFVSFIFLLQTFPPFFSLTSNPKQDFFPAPLPHLYFISLFKFKYLATIKKKKTKRKVVLYFFPWPYVSISFFSFFLFLDMY